MTYARVAPPGWTLAVVEDMHAIDTMGISVVELLPLALLFVALVALLAVSFGAASTSSGRFKSSTAGRGAWPGATSML